MQVSRTMIFRYYFLAFFNIKLKHLRPYQCEILLNLLYYEFELSFFSSEHVAPYPHITHRHAYSRAALKFKAKI